MPKFWKLPCDSDLMVILLSDPDLLTGAAFSRSIFWARFSLFGVDAARSGVSVILVIGHAVIQKPIFFSFLKVRGFRQFWTFCTNLELSVVKILHTFWNTSANGIGNGLCFLSQIILDRIDSFSSQRSNTLWTFLVTTVTQSKNVPAEPLWRQNLVHIV